MATDQLMSYKNNIVSKKDNCIWINLCFIFMMNSTNFFSRAMNGLDFFGIWVIHWKVQKQKGN